MRMVRRVAGSIWVVGVACILARWWLNSDWSETTWTWLNVRIGAGQYPGVASDIELAIVLACAAALACAGTWGVLRLLGLIRARSKA